MNNGRNWPASAPLSWSNHENRRGLAPRPLLTVAAIFVPLTLDLLLWTIVLAMLPPTFIGVLLPVAVGAAVWLSGEKREPLAVRVLALASPMSMGQIALLQPMLASLAASGIEFGSLYVSRAGESGPLAEPFGGRTVVVSPRLLDGMARGTVDQEAATVVLAHAHARREARGGMRRDVAFRLIGLPARILVAALRRASRRLRWLPGASAFGLIGSVVIATAIWRAFEQGTWWMGLILMAATSIAILGRWAPAHWRRQVDAAADHQLVALGLGETLMRLLTADGSARSLERVAALRRGHAVASGPVRHLHLVSG